MFRSSVRSSATLALAFILFGFSTPAFSQDPLAAPIGSRITRAAPADVAAHSRLAQQDHSQAVTIDFGMCVAKRHRPATQKALALSPFGKESKNSLVSLATPDCLSGGSVRIPEQVMRGALFIALYRLDFTKSESIISDNAIYYFEDANGNRDDPSVNEYVAIRQFAECVVRADSMDVRNLVLAAPGSNEEKAALTALSPNFGPCLVQGAQIKFSKNMLVGVLAEVIYRISSGVSR